MKEAEDHARRLAVLRKLAKISWLLAELSEKMN